MVVSSISVLLIFGGESTEHEVSIKSARNVYRALDISTYTITLCYISKDGTQWALVKSFDNLEGPDIQANLGKETFTSNGKEIKVNVIIPILHGKHGEDGEVQGLASLMHIPCVGPGLISAAISMDKDITKRLLRDAGVPVVDWHTWHTFEPAPHYVDLRKKLGDILFVKPSNAGSSVGVSKVRNQAELESALKSAAEYDTIVMIERAVQAREIELAVLGNEKIEIATPGEVITESEFYSYDAKYDASSKASTEIPATLSSDVVTQLKTYAATAYRLIRGQGMARIDFFVTATNEIFLNEINAIPGFTDISMYPKMWEYDGIDNTNLLDRLIELALKKVKPAP